MEELSLQDILRATLRWKKYLFTTFLVLLTITVIIALRWSNYRSTAIVQIELSSISQNIVNNPNENLVTLADQRINQIQQKITSLESLSQIIKKYNLYPDSAESVPIATLTTAMRNKINLILISGAIANPAAAQKQTAEQLSAIGFTLSFDYTDPQLAQQVTDELVTRFLDEDLKMRHTQTKETSDFIAEQISAMEKNIIEQEKLIADFRSKNGESGPAALIFNQQAAANVVMNIQSIEAQITSNKGTQGALRAQLASVSPYSRIVSDGQVFTTPEIQLRALETQYTTLISQYGSNHPDVVKLRRQISAIKSQVGVSSPGNSGELQSQIEDVSTNLAAAENTLGEEHPDVVALKRKLKTLQDTLAKTPKQNKLNPSIKHDADNPVYIQLATQLMTSEEQEKTLLIQRDELLVQRAKYEKAVALNPAIEQELSQLSRDYENSQARFRELKEKKMTADLNEQLELSRKGQRLVVTNPPEVSADTHPRRLFIVLGGLLLSIVGAVASVVIAEFLTQTVYGEKHLAALIGAMPLVVIPHILSESEKTNSAKFDGYMQKIPVVSKLYSFCKKTITRFTLYKKS